MLDPRDSMKSRINYNSSSFIRRINLLKKKKGMQQLSQKYNRTTHDHIFVSPNTNQTSKYFQRSKTTLMKHS